MFFLVWQNPEESFLIQHQGLTVLILDEAPPHSKGYHEPTYRLSN